jgi:hypothetical protein
MKRLIAAPFAGGRAAAAATSEQEHCRDPRHFGAAQQAKGNSIKKLLGVAKAALAVFLAGIGAAAAGGPTTSLHPEFLMTMRASLDPPQIADGNLLIVNVPSGSVEGPRIKGKIIAPSADWLRLLPGGVLRLDVRATIQTDDGEMIFTSYNGIRSCPKEVQERFVKGEVLKPDECYFVTAPTFQTKSEKYGWLNSIQAIGKMVEQKRGEASYVTYDIFQIK